MTPVRLRLSRRAGFNLQAVSRATNGLPAVNVARPGPWGNPFRITAERTPEEAVAEHEAWLAGRPDLIRAARLELRGKNVACWCRDGAPCHGDNWLNAANAAEEG